jgi:hypothetical protein
MIIIRHRRNTLAELEATPRAFGVEVDIRSHGNRLIVHHEPFVEGESFDDWMAAYAHRTLILNVKEEGLEERLLAIMARHQVEDFFFLDQSFPFLVRTARTGERRSAVRVSEYESIETALALAGLVSWVWLDCFTRFPIARRDADRLRAAGFKLCVVSPELQGRQPGEIAAMRSWLTAEGIHADAVCTKEPARWE